MATTLALGLGVAYTLTVGVAQGPSASSPESFAASTEKIDCILGEIIPTPVVECGQTVQVKKPILVAAQNGGAPCPDEYVDFQGEECKCPDGLPINPNRNDCIGPAKRLVNGCCEDGLCPDGSIRIPGGIGCKAEDGFKELDGCCICPCCGSSDPCCGSSDPCCGKDDCCGNPDPCCGNPDPCCRNPGDPNCNPDPCMGNPDPCCGNPDPDCGGGGGGGGKKKCEDSGDPGLDCMGPGCCGTAYCNPENGEWACKCFGSINAGTGMGSTPDEQCIDANGVRKGYYDYDTCGCKFDADKCTEREGEQCWNNGVACGVRSGPACECPPDCNNNGDNFNN